MFKEDDKEVEEIMGRVMSYLMKITFDDASIATQRLAFSVFEITNKITNLEECLNEAK